MREVDEPALAAPARGAHWAAPAAAAAAPSAAAGHNCAAASRRAPVTIRALRCGSSASGPALAGILPATAASRLILSVVCGYITSLEQCMNCRNQINTAGRDIMQSSLNACPLRMAIFCHLRGQYMAKMKRAWPAHSICQAGMRTGTAPAGAECCRTLPPPRRPPYATGIPSQYDSCSLHKKQANTPSATLSSATLYLAAPSMAVNPIECDAMTDTCTENCRAWVYGNCQPAESPAARCENAPRDTASNSCSHCHG